MIVKFDNCDNQQTSNFIKHCYSNMETNELNILTQNFCKKIKGKKYTISTLSQYLFNYKDEPNEIINNIEEFVEIINQSSYGDTTNGSAMVL